MGVEQREKRANALATWETATWMPVTIKSQLGGAWVGTQGSGASASCNALTGDASFSRPQSMEQQEEEQKGKGRVWHCPAGMLWEQEQEQLQVAPLSPCCY